MNTSIRNWFGRQSGEIKVMIVVIALGLALLSIYYLVYDSLEPREEEAIDFAIAALVKHDKEVVELMLTPDSPFDVNDMDGSEPTPGGTVHVASQAMGPTKEEVYIYLDPTMTEGSLLLIVELKKADGEWLIQNAYRRDVGRSTFDDFQLSPTYQSMGHL